MASTEDQPLYARAQATIQTIRKALPAELSHPRIAIVCGSGLGGLASTVEAQTKVEIPYSSVPGFPVSTGS
jgi:purine-nucleoside phosphorylase